MSNPILIMFLVISVSVVFRLLFSLVNPLENKDIKEVFTKRNVATLAILLLIFGSAFYTMKMKKEADKRDIKQKSIDLHNEKFKIKINNFKIEH